MFSRIVTDFLYILFLIFYFPFLFLSVFCLWLQDASHGVIWQDHQLPGNWHHTVCLYCGAKTNWEVNTKVMTFLVSTSQWPHPRPVNLQELEIWVRVLQNETRISLKTDTVLLNMSTIQQKSLVRMCRKNFKTSRGEGAGLLVKTGCSCSKTGALSHTRFLAILFSFENKEGMCFNAIFYKCVVWFAVHFNNTNLLCLQVFTGRNLVSQGNLIGGFKVS